MSPPAGPIGNHYDKYAGAHSIERRLMDGFFGALDGLLDPLMPHRVLEVGCGEGEILQRTATRFPSASVQGVDLGDDRLLREWEQRGVQAEFGDATALRFSDGEFDLVMAIEVLEHIPHPDRALRELARVCQGTVVLSVPFEPIWRMGNMARGRYLKQLGNTPGHVNHWDRWSFERLVGKYFHVEQVVSPLPWTMVRARSKSS